MAQTNTLKYGGAYKLSFAADLTLDPLKGRVVKLIPASNGLTVHLPSTSVFGFKFEQGGAPVLYLFNDTSYDIHIDQPDIGLTGTITPQKVLEVVVIPASDDPAIGGPFVSHWRWEMYDLNVQSQAYFGDPGLSCVPYYRARQPSSAKPAPLSDVYLPASAIPNTDGVDYNFQNLDDLLCYYIHFDDGPVVGLPPSAAVPGAWRSLEVTNDNVSCEFDSSCPACNDNDGYGSGAPSYNMIADKQWGTTTQSSGTYKIRWFVGDAGENEAAAYNPDNAVVFAANQALMLQFIDGMYFEDSIVGGDPYPRRYRREDFQLVISPSNAVVEYPFGSGILAANPVQHDSDNTATDGTYGDGNYTTHGYNIDYPWKFPFVLASPAKIGIQFRGTLPHPGTLHDISDADLVSNPTWKRPTFAIRCANCLEKEIHNDGDHTKAGPPFDHFDQNFNPTDIVLARKKRFIFPASPDSTFPATTIDLDYVNQSTSQFPDPGGNYQYSYAWSDTNSTTMLSSFSCTAKLLELFQGVTSVGYVYQGDSSNPQCFELANGRYIPNTLGGPPTSFPAYCDVVDVP